MSISDVDLLMRQSEMMYYTFQPREDTPEEYDEQTAFYNCDSNGIIWLIGGNGAGTTTCALAKAVKFIMRDQPPPRPATPFWIISEGYDVVMDTCWVEKLCGEGLIPPGEVQWDKISWYRPNQNWPYRVPLKPWPGENQDNYWVLEFKSYEQGRRKFQARSIGGFLFVEQFQFDLLTEVMRGCREYDFSGNKICEFTPIDPGLSYELETMIAEGEVPESWKIFRCNTECAMKHGHVTKAWYDQFFASVSPEMQETRKTGAFASYKGLIYQTFNRSIHVVDDMPIPTKDVIHKRGIDWGASDEHPLAAVFGYKDSLGDWWIYAEYHSSDQTMVWKDHCEKILSIQTWPENDPHFQNSYGDPSRPDLIKEFNNNGIPISMAKNAVYDGIESVRRCLKIHPGRGQPQIHIASWCKQTIKEFFTYRWEKGALQGRNPKAARPVPLKKNDDCMDALRYLIHSDYNSGIGGAKGGWVDPPRRPQVRHRRLGGRR